MEPGHTYLAIDIGAESGRVIDSNLNDDHLVLSEIYRFANDPVRLPDGLHWDVLRLWKDIKAGVTVAVKNGEKIDGIGIDTWGVDFALLDREGSLLGNPYHYRDTRTDNMVDEAFRLIPRQQIFAQTGIQFMQINTLYQLLSMTLRKPFQLELAKSLVMMPDLFNYWLSGRITSEFTIATSSQCFDPQCRDWAWDLLNVLKIPRHLFQPVIQPGTVLGPILPALAEEIGTERTPIIAPACHDTASAVVAVPAENKNFAWISSGTWSIIGAEVNQPSLSPLALEYNMTNEGGVFGTWRLSKNIMGLWLVQECKRIWANRGEVLSYDEMTHLANEAQPFLAVIDPDDNPFLYPGDMPERIRSYCYKTGQTAPQTKGEVIRVVLESIALKYRWVLRRLERLTQTFLEPVHIIGGGTKNNLLNQFTADATHRTVIAGPVEATAIGNVLVQAIALSHLDSLSDARRVIRNSFPLQTFQPKPLDDWDEAYARLLPLLEGKNNDDPTSIS